LDKSGHGNNGQAVAVEWVAEGHRGGAASFGKDNSYITVPNNEDLNPHHLTLAAWINTSYSDPVWRRIFDKGTGKGYVLSMCGDDRQGHSFRGEVDVEPGKTWTHSVIKVADGQWHHVAGTYDGADAVIYVDGQHAQRRHWVGDVPFTTYALTIGANRSNPEAALGEVGASFNGMMDDVMMFNRALSAGEIQALFKSQGGVLTDVVAAPAPQPAPPVAVRATNTTGLSYGLYIHYGIATFAHPGEQGQIPAERFAPAEMDVKSWPRAAKEAGMTFAVLTAKHESGFCLWDSPDYDYCVAHSPFKGDIIGDFIAACNAGGILPGVHYSIPDAYNEGAVRGGGPVPALYFKLIKKHITELQTRYPGLRILVLDEIGRLSRDQFVEISQLSKQLNPACVLLNSSGNEAFGPRHEADTIIKGWMWRPQAQLNPAQALFAHYNRAQQAGHVFILNVAPDTRGHIADEQLAVLTRIKEMIATRPVTSPSASNRPATQPSSSDRIKQVKDLFDQGLITKEQYDQKVKEIMGSL
jgi:hypothetical protein